ncbi:hypothetical protein M1O29_00485 [Dehalococcoidia bacterium]|nr:hypothetical protein [Dehalococcoidia bacterium]
MLAQKRLTLNPECKGTWHGTPIMRRLTFLVIVLSTLLGSCSTGPEATAAPQFAEGEASSLVKRQLNDDCITLRRMGNWKTKFLGAGIWYVSYLGSTGEFYFKVYEKTQTVEQTSGPFSCID